MVLESRMLAEAASVRLKSLLPGTSVVGWTRSWDVYQHRQQSVADVVILDNELTNGVPTPAKVAALVVETTGVVVLGSTTYGPAIQRLLDAGAHSYVLASDPSETLAAAVDSAFRSEPHRSAAVLQLLAGQEPPRVSELTRRELEVVGAYISGSGASVPETAARFGISVETVRTHISHARRKYSDGPTDPISKMELRRRMIRDGWIAG
ncbi:hypothetical protein B7R54_03240 [Subtercola boreus]|uniref:HTH luxR-type domain-containing protein n=2 Tax=Subtercola boreus TaxID=120213 RepID=A0A3E0VG58_9MICO|nr:hypothetical protein B7R54_03240 [Subtercola boreus]TQL54747.1 DNA-binding NarL/FixJ family response regulator [Subtercola boreus]